MACPNRIWPTWSSLCCPCDLIVAERWRPAQMDLGHPKAREDFAFWYNGEPMI